MIQDTIKERAILRDLGDGLILRRATPADVEALAAFNARIHSDAGPEQPDERIAAWTRDLLNGDHPTVGADDFTIVENTRTGEIVSSLNLISQTWSYAGIEFGVGRPELVGTHPDYRRRGLVRAQFDVIHQWSVERGEMMQAITGIPWYYRQFGYEMGLALGGGRIGYKPQAPKLMEGETEAYRVRPATQADLPFIAQVYEYAVKRDLIACVRDERMWRYEVLRETVYRRVARIIESADGEPVGFLAHPSWLRGSWMVVPNYELKPGVSWLAVTPSVIRYLQMTGEAYAARDGKDAFEAFAFLCGTDHPVYQAVADRLPHVRPLYAWYVRVPDLPGFIRHIAPALERRLADSIGSGHTGELKISFYQDGLRLVFDKGHLARAEAWQPQPGDGGGATFPHWTFLQLLLGYRSLEELRYAFADCGVETDEARALLEILFPKQASAVWPVA